MAVSDFLNRMLEQATSEEAKIQITAAIEKLLESYKTSDIEQRLSLFTEDVYFNDPVGTPPLTSRDQLRELYYSMFNEGWRFTMDINKFIICGNMAIIDWIVDPIHPVYGSGKFKTSNVLTFDNDWKIKSSLTFCDESCIY